MNLIKGSNNTSVDNDITLEKDGQVRPITVILAEELSGIRQKLKLLLESEPDIKVVSEVNNGFDALDATGVLHPDVLILGLTASNTLEIVRLINQRFPKTGIVVPYKHDNENHVQEMLRYGVKACILKTTSHTYLLNAIREWGQNNVHLRHSVLKDNPENLVIQTARAVSDPYEILTPREREILSMVVRGLTNNEIASHLSISRRTVEVHRHNLLKKLGLRNQQEQLINYAIDRGIKT